MRLIRRATLLATGAALVYFLEPEGGPERRRRMAEQLRNLGGDTSAGAASGPDAVPVGQDTATGTDPDARYEQPGYEDVSFGQATARDADLVDRLLAEEAGDKASAEERFQKEAVGAPTLARQSDGDKQSTDDKSVPGADFFVADTFDGAGRGAS